MSVEGKIAWSFLSYLFIVLRLDLDNFFKKRLWSDFTNLCAIYCFMDSKEEANSLTSSYRLSFTPCRIILWVKKLLNSENGIGAFQEKVVEYILVISGHYSIPWLVKVQEILLLESCNVIALAWLNSRSSQIINWRKSKAKYLLWSSVNLYESINIGVVAISETMINFCLSISQEGDYFFGSTQACRTKDPLSCRFLN